MLWRREWLALRRLSSSGWLLVYGRRKTGKTFTARMLLPWRLYATVARDRSVLVEERGGRLRVVGPEEALEEVVGALRRGWMVVVDEFQRLPERFWDALQPLHAEQGSGLVLLASSLGVVSRVFDRRSPLLGLVLPFELGIPAYSDVVASLAARMEPLHAVLWGLLLREPWLTPLPGIGRGEPWGWLAANARLLLEAARGLVGEVFFEEDRRLTMLYEAVLRLLGAGVWDAARMAALLRARGLIASPSPGTVTGVLDRLAEMGLVEKTRLWRTRGRRVYYRHRSPLLGILYGLAERLLLDENPAQPLSRVAEAARMLAARELQFSVGELLAEHHGGVAAYTILPGGSGDVDVVILDPRGRAALAAYEVKMGVCSRGDLERAVEAARHAGALEAGAVCLRGVRGEPPPGISRVMDARGLARMAVEAALEGARRLAAGYTASLHEPV